MKEEYQSGLNRLASWLGGWESVNGNPDVYIFRDYDGNYYLLTYNYDKDYGRGLFSCYRVESDESGYYIYIVEITIKETPIRQSKLTPWRFSV